MFENPVQGPLKLLQDWEGDSRHCRPPPSYCDAFKCLLSSLHLCFWFCRLRTGFRAWRHAGYQLFGWQCEWYQLFWLPAGLATTVGLLWSCGLDYGQSGSQPWKEQCSLGFSADRTPGFGSCGNWGIQASVSPSLSLYCSPLNTNKWRDRLLGPRIVILFRKPADQEDGGLLSQRTIFSELEFRLLLY